MPPLSTEVPSPAAAPSPAQQHLAAARQARQQGQLAPGLEAAQMALALAADDASRAAAGHLACFFHFRLGQLAQTVALGEPLLPMLQALQMDAERRELLRCLTLAAADLGRFDLALDCASECCALAERSGDLAEHVIALNAMAASFERMGDPWQAERLMLEALAQAERQSQAFPLLSTLNNLSAVTIGAYYLLRDVAPAEAEAVLLRAEDYARRAHAQLPQVDDRFFAVFVEGNLGEVLVHRGVLDEADALLQRALQQALDQGHAAQACRIRCSIAEALLARGNLPGAHQLLLALWQHDAADLPQATLLRLHHAQYRACRALGLADEALAHHERYERFQRERAARQLRAQSELLVTRVEAERARLEAQAERARAAELARHANQDALTGLGNRRHLDQQLPPLLAAAAASGQPLSLAVVDLDRFKQINDAFGHLCGDRVLQTMAQLLRENTRQADLLARMGGEEFLIVLPETAPDRALEVCERLRERVASYPWQTVAEGLAVTVSIGLAQAPPHEAAALYDRADRALYRAKQDGRNRVRTA